MIDIVKRIINQEKRKVKREIEELTRQYELTLDDDKRVELIRLHEDYKLKFRKEYKG